MVCVANKSIKRKSACGSSATTIDGGGEGEQSAVEEDLVRREMQVMRKDVIDASREEDAE